MPKSTRKNKKIYLDHAASVAPNPSSIHELGVAARGKLENIRRDVARILSARPEEIIFTSGGTEGNNLAIQGVILAVGFLPHVVTTNIEHPSVLETCKLLEQRGLAEISIISVEENGIVDPKKIKQAIKKNTVLVSVMYANNEIGTIQPVKEIAREIRHWRKNNLTRPSATLSWPGEGLGVRYPLFHTDAVQAVNYLDLNVERLGVDLLTLSGSKILNAGRVGVLYKKKNVPLAPVWGGGDQEFGIRPGTENLPAILEFAKAFVAAQKIKEKESKRLRELQKYFLKKISRATLNILVNGDLESRLPNIVSITFPKIPSDLLVIELSARGIMCSSKSACKSGESGGSYVLKAIEPNADPEIGALRFSLGLDTTKEDLGYTVQSLKEILQKLKKWYD